MFGIAKPINRCFKRMRIHLDKQKESSVVQQIRIKDLRFTIGIVLAVFLSPLSFAVDDTELAKKTQNPISDLMSLPLQYNWDENMGPEEEGRKSTLNIQPVLPFSISEHWNAIFRTILPVIDQKDILPNGATDESGIGDVVQSLFFSPKAPTDSGWIWGVGPVFLLPTASDDMLGAEKWGIGPTAVMLKQHSGFTYGMLANHIWSVAGNNDRDDVSATFLQPFFSYTTKKFTTYTINTESTYNWEDEQWSVPLNFLITQMLKTENHIFTLQAGVRYWVDAPDNGPDGIGYRLTLTLLFPK